MFNIELWLISWFNDVHTVGHWWVTQVNILEQIRSDIWCTSTCNWDFYPSWAILNRECQNNWKWQNTNCIPFLMVQLPSAHSSFPCSTASYRESPAPLDGKTEKSTDRQTLRTAEVACCMMSTSSGGFLVRLSLAASSFALANLSLLTTPAASFCVFRASGATKGLSTWNERGTQTNAAY